VGIIQQVNLMLVKRQKLCEDAGHEVVRRGECGDKIQEMKKEFAGMIEIAVKLRPRGKLAWGGAVKEFSNHRNFCLQ
jgi:hypothetical protein